MELEFHGATDGTTGSCHLLRAGGKQILFECGLFQGRRAEAQRRNARFQFRPREIDAVVLSHAHIDHSGKLPMLVRHGYDGPIYATSATVDLADAMLMDSANIQVKDAEFLNRRLMFERSRDRRGRARSTRRDREWRTDDDAPALYVSNPPLKPIVPLYLPEDVRDTLALFQAREWGAWFSIGANLRVRFHDAGHILGSSWVECEVRERGRTTRLIFTGDYGRAQPILRDPTPLEPGQVVISECTYGNRLHPPLDDTERQLTGAVERLMKRGHGKLLIPAFAVGRTQHVLYVLERIFEQRRSPPPRVVVDSPLASKATRIVARHPECFDEDALERLARARRGESRIKVDFTETVDESKELNRARGPVIIVSASGMMESGRILHHLAWAIDSADTEVAVVGYQANGTLDRRLVEGESEVNIFGLRHAVRARVTVMNGFSAHADRDDLLRALTPIAAQCEVLFLVHGENDQRLPFARTLRDRGFARVECPRNATKWSV